MDFTLTSSIDELHRTGIIKKRTYNICKALGISTVGQIISTPLFAFSNATGAGKKTVWEISRVKDMFGIRGNGDDDTKPSAQKSAQRRHKGSSGAPSLFKDGEVRSQLSFMLNTEAKTLLDRTPELTEEDLTTCFGPNLRMVESLIKMPRELFRFVDTGDAAKDKRLHKFLGSLFQKALLASSRHSPHYTVVAKAREYYRSHQKEHEMLSAVRRLSPEQQDFLLSAFHQQCDELSVRAKNGFRAVDSIELLVGLLYSPTFFTDNRMTNCGSSVQDEWNMRSGQFITNFEHNLDIFLTGDAATAETHLRGQEIRSVFPFLDSGDMLFVIDHHSRYGRYPGLWLLLHYIRRASDSGDNQAKAYCMVYGLGADGRRTDIKTLAASLGMSDQNVRNYLSTELRCPSGLAEAATAELMHLHGDVISEGDSGWALVNETNSLNLEPLQLMGLFSAMRQGYKIDCVAGKYFLIKRELLRKVKLQVCFSKLQAIVKRRRKVAEEVDLCEILRDGLPETDFHPSYRRLADIYMEALADNDSVEDVGEGRIKLLPNSIDRMKAFEDILEEAGRPMHFDEIIEAFCQRYPQESNIKKSSVRSFLHRSELIKSRGKSGSYVHASDSEVYTGTITELLHTRLREAGRPMTLTELVEKVRNEFPETTRSSVNSLMLLDARKRFRLLADDKCALVDEDYDGEELNERPSRTRKTLIDRMEDFRVFVEANGRFPFFTATEEEKALRRWMENVLAGRIADSDEERAQLESIIAANESAMPKSARDEAFREMCGRIEEIVAQSGALPTSHNMREYQWIRKHGKGLVGLSPYQTACYERLCETLRKYGLEL